MKFTRAQELALIDIGMQTLLRNALPKTSKKIIIVEPVKRKRHKLSLAQRKAISVRMKEVWAKKNKYK